MGGTKECARCKQLLLSTNFGKYLKNKDGKYSYCRPCASLRYRQWAKLNPEKVRDTKRRQWLKKLYGITQEQYEDMAASQNGLCEICGKPGKIVKRTDRFKLQIDHDHRSGKIRGLLCHLCNTILGCANDETMILESAIAYLQKYR